MFNKNERQAKKAQKLHDEGYRELMVNVGGDSKKIDKAARKLEEARKIVSDLNSRVGKT